MLPKAQGKIPNSGSARIVVPPGKTSVHLRVDSDVFEWFKKRVGGHLTRMNAVLRSYVNAHRRQRHRRRRDVNARVRRQGLSKRPSQECDLWWRWAKTRLSRCKISETAPLREGRQSL